MKCKLKIGNLEFEVDGADRKELFKSISEIQETFGQTICGNCKSAKIKYVTRVVDDNTFYELHCTACNHHLEFGQGKKNNSIYPAKRAKVKDAKGKVSRTGDYLPNNGWVKNEFARENAPEE